MKGTPAAKAGFKRGNIILSINDEKITPDNYADLYYKPTLKVSLRRTERKYHRQPEQVNRANSRQHVRESHHL